GFLDGDVADDDDGLGADRRGGEREDLLSAPWRGERRAAAVGEDLVDADLPDDVQAIADARLAHRREQLGGELVGGDDAPIVVEEQHARRQVADDALEALALRGLLVAHHADEERVLHRQRGLADDGREEVEVLGGERVRLPLRVEVHEAEDLLAVDERHAHRRADALPADAGGAVETLVGAGVGGDDAGLRGDDLAEDAGRDHDVGGAAVAPARDLQRRRAGGGVDEHRHAALGGEEVERGVEEAAEERLGVVLDAERARQLDGGPELLVITAKLFERADVGGGPERDLDGQLEQV